MNWIKELCSLYDNNKDEIGKVQQGRYEEPLILLPIFHTTVKAQITITLREDGTFLRAEPVVEEDSLTIIPVTEKSASRTAGIEPHPLCDNLKYIAGDYMLYIVPEKKKDFSANYTAYMKQLESWAQSTQSYYKVVAIKNYLQKASLIKDLISANILKLDENNIVLPNEKIGKVKQTESFVRFRVQRQPIKALEILSKEPAECWLDRSLHQSYISYCKASAGAEYGLSYLTGENGKLAYLHPKKIRNEGDGAKLISANDEINYTFRGRFVNKEEAFAIGYEDSQKAHNALKWIIRKQGRNWSTLCLVTWESNLAQLPDWSQDTDMACDEFEMWDEEFVEEQKPTTNHVDASRFQAAISGYRSKLEIDSKMIIMAFDAATTGRLAMVESKALQSSIYLQNLLKWYQECGWEQEKYKNKKIYSYYGMVGIKDIANILYGIESKEGFSLKGSKERMNAEVCKRLLPCIIYGRPVPEDMVRLAIQRASSPVSYENIINWRRTLALACSLVKRRELQRKNKEVWTMALNEKSCNRSYLYGRLLAMADRIEYRTMDKEGTRETNAKRYMNAFAQQPFRTWKIIEERMQPYMSKLKTAERIKYEHLIEEICWTFEEGTFELNESLDGTYLLGYHNQSYALRNKIKEELKNE